MCAKQWKSIVARGDDALQNTTNKPAIYFYTKSMSEAERMIKETILNSDGDTEMLNLYTASCRMLAMAYTKTRQQKTALLHIDAACTKIVEVIKNPGYPIPLRGQN